MNYNVSLAICAHRLFQLSPRRPTESFIGGSENEIQLLLRHKTILFFLLYCLADFFFFPFSRFAAANSQSARTSVKYRDRNARCVAPGPRTNKPYKPRFTVLQENSPGEPLGRWTPVQKQLKWNTKTVKKEKKCLYSLALGNNGSIPKVLAQRKSHLPAPCPELSAAGARRMEFNQLLGQM